MEDDDGDDDCAEDAGHDGSRVGSCNDEQFRS